MAKGPKRFAGRRGRETISEAKGRPDTASPDRGVARERIAAFVNDETTERMVRQCLADLGAAVTSVRRGDVVTATSHLAGERSPLALIVDITGVISPIARLHELAEVCEAGLSVLAIGDSNDVALYRNLLQTGVSEYVVKPVSRSLLQNAIRQILGLGKGDRQVLGATIISVVGTRGGVGASTMAANLAWGLATKTSHGVALVDLDLQHGGCDLLLGVEADDGLIGALVHPERVDDLYLERSAILCDRRVALYASRVKPGSSPIIQPEALALMVERLAQKFQYVILDAARGNDALLGHAMELAQHRVIVVDQTTLALRDLLELTRSFAPHHETQRNLVVLNRFGEPGASGIPIKTMEQTLGLTIDAVVPFEAKSVVAAANAGTPIVKTTGPVSKAIMAIVEDLCGERHEEEGKKWWKFFGE